MTKEWEDICKSLGFNNETELFTDLYVTQGISLPALSKSLGFSRSVVRSHILACGITLRGRGGPNRMGMSVFNKITDEELKDVVAVMRKYNLHYSTVAKERRRRGIKGRPSNPDQGGGLPLHRDIQGGSVSPSGSTEQPLGGSTPSDPIPHIPGEEDREV